MRATGAQSAPTVGRPADLGGNAKPHRDPNPSNKIWLLELLMVLVLVILLNLLIAIMGSSYEKVHHSAELEVLREKSLIILDIERFLLLYIKWFKKDVEELFPRWLHVLVPVSMIESEGHTPVLRECEGRLIDQ